jgi:hypothetical protein
MDMTNAGTTTAAPAWFVTGYQRALARFHETARADVDPMDRFIALFETLNWAAAMLDPDSPLYATLEADDTAQGMRYVRNRAHHQWADVLDPQDVPFPRPVMATGRPGGMVLGPIWVRDWFWKPLDQLPAPTRGKDETGRDAYEAKLAGQPARFALDHLADLLPQ